MAGSDDADIVQQFAEAVAFAAKAHAGQVRGGKGDAYFNHLAEVAALCASIEPVDPVLVMAAYLHDTIEETRTGESDIRARFGDAVADLVVDVTDPPGLKGKPRRMRQVTHTASASDRVKCLKLADKTSNVEALLGLPADRFDLKSNTRYLKWARRVVAVCRGVAPTLEARFDASAVLLEAEILTHRQSGKCA